MALDVEKRLKELKEFSHEEIQKEAAYAWASRACAAFQYATEAQDYQEHIKWLIQFEDYKHEALEHAALIEAGSGLLTEITQLMDAYEEKVLKS